MKIEELAGNDGKDGRPAYFRYKNDVYDVTESTKWKNGRHMNRHNAGEDLSESLAAAPHGEEVFDRVKHVGTIEEGPPAETFPDSMEQLRELYRKFHPHPVSIHFPICLFHGAALMQVLFLVFRQPCFEAAAFYALIGGVLSSPPAILAGFASWWINYQAVMTRLFKIKIVFSGVVLLVGGSALLWRWFVPSVSYGGDLVTVLYSGMVILCVPAVTAVAFHGGKITWPG